jgi:diaminopimelate decarboxylase
LGLGPGLTVNAAGHLALGGADLVQLAGRFGTPLYVFDEGVVRSQCRAFRDAFARYPAGARVVYAGKAFLTLAMARIVAEEGLHLDVVSGGELYVALRAGFPPGRVHFHGNNKTADEIGMALDAGVGRFVVDNFREIDLLESAAARRGVRPRCLVRVAPGVEAHTHHYIQTGKQDSKFGFDLATGQAMEAVRRVAASPHLELAGLHAHVASQVLDVEPFRVAAEVLLDAAADAERATRVPVGELNLGGGMGIRYTDEDRPPSPEAFVEAIVEAVEEGCRRRGLSLPVLAIEPGRAIVGEAAVAVYTVGAQKRVPGLTPYVAVDGGMGDNIRPALYGASYRVLVAGRPLDPPEERVHVVGRYCESGDFLARDVPLPRVEAGDLLVFPSAGAYQYPMASNYNRVPRPAVVLVRDGDAELIVERETYADLCARERIPERLAPRADDAVRVPEALPGAEAGGSSRRLPV